MQKKSQHKIIPLQNLLLAVLSLLHHPCSVSSQHAPVATYHLTIQLLKTLLWFSEVLQDLLELSFQIVQNHSTIKKSNFDLLIVLQVKKKKAYLRLWQVSDSQAEKNLGQKAKVSPCKIKHRSMETYGKWRYNSMHSWSQHPRTLSSKLNAFAALALGIQLPTTNCRIQGGHQSSYKQYRRKNLSPCQELRPTSHVVLPRT